jgi:hypothetical protein
VETKMPKYKLNNPIHFQGKRHEKGSIVEMTKKDAAAHGSAVEEVKKEEKKPEDPKNPDEKK